MNLTGALLVALSTEQTHHRGVSIAANSEEIVEAFGVLRTEVASLRGEVRALRGFLVDHVWDGPDVTCLSCGSSGPGHAKACAVVDLLHPKPDDTGKAQP